MRSVLSEDKGGQMIMINLLFLFMTITIMIAFIPALKSILDIAKQSDNLNCPGFDFDKSGTVGSNALDYNSSLNTDTVACLAINLYLPYIILIILIGGVAKLLYSQTPGQQPVGGF